VTSRAFRDRLLRRLNRAGVSSPRPETFDSLEQYVQLLARWNQKINLTALPLDPPTDEALDRLLVEPIAAARHLARFSGQWMDLGSGGGSPALPLMLVGMNATLILVESKARKAAFLREVLRTIGLTNASVEHDRAESLALRYPHSAQLLTVRAVRIDSRFAETAALLLDEGGHLAMFGPAALRTVPRGFERVQTTRLLEGHSSYLDLFRVVFHVERLIRRDGDALST